MGSVPTQEMSRPRQAETRPRMMLLPDTPAMMVRPKTQTMKYSAVPSWAAILATWGPRNNSIRAENTPPKVEAYRAIFSAALVRPWRESGWPSSMVAAAWGVPGVLMRMADTLPP